MREHLGSSKISEPTRESDLRLPQFEVRSLGTGGVTTGKLDRGMPWGIQVVAYSAHVLTDPSQARAAILRVWESYAADIPRRVPPPRIRGTRRRWRNSRALGLACREEGRANGPVESTPLCALSVGHITKPKTERVSVGSGFGPNKRSPAVSTGCASTPWPFNESSLTLEVDHQEGQVVLLPLSFRIF